MPIHPIPQYLHRRQQDVSEPIPVPTGIAGVGGTTFEAPPTATASSLVIDTAAGDGGTAVIAPSLAPFTSIVVTATLSPSASTSSASSSSSSNKPISLSMVIGVCLAALVGAILLVFIGWWIYKRSAPAIKRRRSGIPRTPLRNNNNARREVELLKTRAEAWNKLDEVDVKLAEKAQTRQVDSVGPMEKLTMFKNSISLPSADKESPPVTFEHHPYIVPFSPNGGEEPQEPRRRPFVGRAVIGGNSWVSDEATIRVDSRGAMSPPVSKAIPTPAAVSSYEPHRWESAKVMHFDGESGMVEDRRGYTSVEKGKGREKYPSRLLPLPLAHHVANSSTSSTSSNERAIQSLIAALDVTPEEVQERLRVASMQGSMIAVPEEDWDVTSAFPR